MIKGQPRDFTPGHVKAGSEMAVGAVETDPGSAIRRKRHRRPQLAVLIKEIQTRRAIARDIERDAGAVFGIDQIEPDRSVVGDAQCAAYFAAAVVEHELT